MPLAAQKNAIFPIIFFIVPQHICCSYVPLPWPVLQFSGGNHHLLTTVLLVLNFQICTHSCTRNLHRRKCEDSIRFALWGDTVSELVIVAGTVVQESRGNHQLGWLSRSAGEQGCQAEGAQNRKPAFKNTTSCELQACQSAPLSNTTMNKSLC